MAAAFAVVFAPWFALAASPEPVTRAPGPSPSAPWAFGLSASAGLGTQYGDVGAQVLGVLPVAATAWTLFAGVGVGATPAPERWRTYDGRVPWKLAPVFTTGASVGRRHRLSGAIGYGRVALQPVVVQGAIVDASTVHGAFGEVGYEYVDPRGFVFRIFPLGISRTTDAFFTWTGQETGYSLSVGLGWRMP